MAAIITEKFRLHNADQFKESFSETAASNYYLFVGKSSPFTTTTKYSDTETTGGTEVQLTRGAKLRSTRQRSHIKGNTFGFANR